MNIYVIMKRTFDTEEKIVIENGKISEEGVEFIINPYDEYAIEEAIQLRDDHGGEVTVVSIGDEEVEKELRTALAMGADKAVLINNEDLDDSDQYTTTALLAAYFEDKEFDIILGGNVSNDNSTGQVGPRLAEKLGIAYVTTITKLDIDGTTATMERDVEGDMEIVEAQLPLLVTAQQGLNEPRYPSLPGIMKAKKKPLENIDYDELDVEDDEIEAKTETIERYLPPKKEAGKVLEGELGDQVEELVKLLRQEAKVI
ncbi:electron transfer flavoprotein subunit beta/FixA family protein [Guptibacillus hwajinpoensis]|uniref:Electron transfer flavoprotein beta subunit n=2 Tax=Guptibacillus hwajinpoensis TaxID=208199 RepID=A0ABU0JWA1_9BACL|nr:MULTISPECIES: electron transfer flavoprotein subunit beta/FixA family protein [Alkalihalobacillus]KMM37462.1 electron transfer flavoprotein subunit beta [Alkalihalobacillus macyae]MDP4550522.1 electron transfer flavoprotein subunit beta/FixA family protein [Alkalihalobacillus macyae]MDQ0481367.1 electron transfer flavoprotein beta subunit [Alkalihalobacillus hemicentroti]